MMISIKIIVFDRKRFCHDWLGSLNPNYTTGFLLEGILGVDTLHLTC